MGLPWDAVLHSTRHTALTDLGASGADAFTIREMAGHANVTTSQRYVHPVPETVANAVQETEPIPQAARYSETSQVVKLLILQVRKWRNWQTHQT